MKVMVLGFLNNEPQLEETNIVNPILFLQFKYYIWV